MHCTAVSYCKTRSWHGNAALTRSGDTDDAVTPLVLFMGSRRVDVQYSYYYCTQTRARGVSERGRLSEKYFSIIRECRRACRRGDASRGGEHVLYTDRCRRGQSGLCSLVLTSYLVPGIELARYVIRTYGGFSREMDKARSIR